jgi:hypothetical protein
MLKIIIIIIGYILNNFTIHIIIVNYLWKKIQNKKNEFIFLEKKEKKLFCQCGNWPLGFHKSLNCQKKNEVTWSNNVLNK